MKKNAIKTVVLSAFVAVGLAACTGTPDAQQGAAPTSTPTSPTLSTSPTSQSSTPPSVVTEVVTATVTNPPQQQSVRNVDNRPGYGALKLGMSIAEAKAAGLVSSDFGLGDSRCWFDSKAAASTQFGVERITLPADARTSTGLGVGSTFADVKRAYPAAKEYRDGWSVDLGSYSYEFIGSSSAERFADTDKIRKIKMAAKNIYCPLAAI